MLSFLRAHGSEIKGVLNGWDRLRFRGTLRRMAYPRGVMNYLWVIQVLLKDFREWAASLTERVRQSTQALAEAAGRPLRYLHSGQEDKDRLAREIAAADGVTEGLICVLTCIEPCYSYEILRDAKAKRLELRLTRTKCLHQYFYLQHPQFGRMHLRLQTWLPFTIHLNLNGRDWLAEQLRQAGVEYEQRDNCFVEVADVPQAQQLLNQQLRTPWSSVLEGLRQQWHPTHPELFVEPQDYYWSADQTEWASDLLFRSPEALAAIYPKLARQAIAGFAAQDVLRFLGRRPEVWRFHTSQLHSSLATRPEGLRVKHQLNHNAVKMYDKQGSVLRVETTINDAADMKAYRSPENNPTAPKEWLPLRKGVADLHRRAEISQASNERYLEALAGVEHPEPLGQTVRDLCRSVTWHDRRARALRPFEPDDSRLLTAINRGEFAIQGFRNRDLRVLLYGESTDPQTTKRQAGKITRQIRLLRAHGLIHKVPKTHRYQLTDHGRIALTALQAAQQADTRKLLALAA